MKNFDKFSVGPFFTAALLCSGHILADAGSSDVHHNSNLNAAAFPFNPDQGWYTQETLLIWRPYLENVDFGSVDTITPGTLLSTHVKKPDFDWNAGVRLGAGRYLPHDLWDLSLWMTYFYGTADQKTSFTFSDFKMMSSAWAPATTEVPVFNSGKVDWRLNFFAWDLTLGREYRMLRTLTAHPFFGLRATAIYQDYTARYTLSDPEDGAVGTEQFKANTHFIGAGPRAGSDFAFTFTNGWAFTGSLAGAFFAGHYYVKETLNSTEGDIADVDVILGNYKITDGNYDIRTQLEGSLGVSYETWVRNHTVRIAPSIVFEGSTWFAMNDFLRLTHKTSQPPLPNEFYITGADRVNGDLSFIGVNINLHIDF